MGAGERGSPLSSDEIDHVLACWQAFELQKPSDTFKREDRDRLLANVLAELRRAKRQKDEDRLFAAAVGGSLTAEDAVELLPLAL